MWNKYCVSNQQEDARRADERVERVFVAVLVLGCHVEALLCALCSVLQANGTGKEGLFSGRHSSRCSALLCTLSLRGLGDAASTVTAEMTRTSEISSNLPFARCTLTGSISHIMSNRRGVYE